MLIVGCDFGFVKKVCGLARSGGLERCGSKYRPQSRGIETPGQPCFASSGSVRLLAMARLATNNKVIEIAGKTRHRQPRLLVRPEKVPATSRICGKIKSMPYILEHLSSLRQEITDLRNMNARFTGKGADSQIDQSAVEMRANRLVEIKKELSQMLNRPEDPAVWWEKGGRRNRVA